MLVFAISWRISKEKEKNEARKNDFGNVVRAILPKKSKTYFIWHLLTRLGAGSFLHLFGQMRRRKLFRKKLQTCRFLHYASATNKYSSAQIERQTCQPFLIAVPGGAPGQKIEITRYLDLCTQMGAQQKCRNQ